MMATEKRLIDANALLVEIEKVYADHYEQSAYQFIHDFVNAIRRRIRRASTVDAVEVVHCCDCKKCVAFQRSADSEVMLTCTYHTFQLVDPTDYCVWGERKNK